MNAQTAKVTPLLSYTYPIFSQSNFYKPGFRLIRKHIHFLAKISTILILVYNILLEIFLVIIWLARTAGSISQSTYYWQLKEYRFDRMREFLFQQKGHQVFLNFFHIVLFFALLLYFILAYLLKNDGAIVQNFAFIVGTIFLAESLRYAHQFYLRKFKRPKLTIKAILIFLLTFFVEIIIFYSYYVFLDYSITLSQIALILALVSFIDQDINAFVIMLINYFSNLVKKRIYKKAHDKRMSRPDLIVIGITGSFGKTSVKEFLSHILTYKYSVLKTEKNTNTEIGIAQTILNKLTDKHQVFVCEMGAYSAGEITVCSYMAHPRIGIFTGLNEQHMALFGSLDNTFYAKWELIHSLPDDGIAIINVDSAELNKRLIHPRCQTLLCSTSGQSGEVAKNITVKTDSVSFTYRGQKFQASLVGEFQVINLLMSIVAAEKLGMSLESIAKMLKTIKAPDKTMSLKKFTRGYILDDSYNVNPDGLKAALSHLDLFKDHIKVIFFPGILELGEESENIHYELAAKIAEHVDYAFFTDPAFSQFLTRGILSNALSRDQFFSLRDQKKMLEQLKALFKKHKKEKFVVLFESRGAEQVMKKIGK